MYECDKQGLERYVDDNESQRISQYFMQTIKPPDRQSFMRNDGQTLRTRRDNSVWMTVRRRLPKADPTHKKQHYASLVDLSTLTICYMVPIPPQCPCSRGFRRSPKQPGAQPGDLATSARTPRLASE
jgi:hypothetical protein